MLLLLLGVLLIFLGLMVLLWPRGKDLKEKIEENGDEVPWYSDQIPRRRSS